MNSFDLTEGQWVVHKHLGVSEVRAVDQFVKKHGIN